MFGIAGFKRRKALEQVSHYRHSPAELAYHKPGDIIVSVPVSRCRMNLTMLPASRNPFVMTLQEGHDSYENSPLFQFYDSVKPATVGQLLSVMQSPIASLPAMATVMPCGLSHRRNVWTRWRLKHHTDTSEKKPSRWARRDPAIMAGNILVRYRIRSANLSFSDSNWYIRAYAQTAIIPCLTNIFMVNS